MRDVWSQTPIAFVQQRPGCPYCTSMDRELVKSVGQGDGSTERRYKCRQCGELHRLVVEPFDTLPTIGNSTMWT